MDEALLADQRETFRLRGVGIISRREVRQVIPYVRYLVRELSALNIPVLIEHSMREYLKDLPENMFQRVENFPSWANLLIVFGGDGTILRVVHLVPRISKRLLLCINLGRIGFLAEIEPEEIRGALPKIIHNREFFIESVNFIQAEINGKSIKALNEILILSREPGRIVGFRVYKGESLIYEGRADGLLLATKLGSTAYIAALGGPVIDPELDVLVLGMLCPLCWGFRPVIMPTSSLVKVEVNEAGILISDGFQRIVMDDAFTVKARLSKQCANFIRLSRDSFYRRLNRRLTMKV